MVDHLGYDEDVDEFCLEIMMSGKLESTDKLIIADVILETVGLGLGDDHDEKWHDQAVIDVRKVKKRSLDIVFHLALEWSKRMTPSQSGQLVKLGLGQM